MLIGTVYKTNDFQNNKTIILDGCKLTHVSSAKFLGITIDENLKWKSHTNNVCEVCSRNVGVLNKVKHFLLKTSLYKLYCSLIMPYVTYGLSLCGRTAKEYMTKLFKIRKRAFRIVSNSSYLCHTKPLFEKFNTVNFFFFFFWKQNLAFLCKSIKLGYFLHLLIIYLQIYRALTIIIRETKSISGLKFIKL